jgi:hypothetical protein
MATRRPTPTEFRNLVRNDAAVSEQVFQHYVNNGTWGVADEDTARLNFYLHMQTNTPEFRAWAQAYLPHYTPAPLGGRLNIGRFSIDARIRDALIAGGAMAGAGLVGLIFSDEIGNEMARNAVNNASQTALIMSPAVALVSYVNTKSQRTAKAIGSAALVLGASIFAYLTGSDMDSRTLGEGVQTFSKIAGAASPVVGLVKYIKN